MKKLLLFPLLLLMPLMTSCGNGGNINNPAFQPQIINLTDSFSFQVTNITNVTQSVHYTWQNTGISANINQATQITGGTAILTLRDANGTPVYQANLMNNGTFTSISGTTGNWTIDVALSGVSGTINFRVQKP